jgi:putative tryptophan/tyrosine transport system substrate-binding protein
MRRRDFIIAIGGAAALSNLRPLATKAQQSMKQHRIAYLALLPGENMTYAKPFLQRLLELGYREGQNMVWDYRSAEGHTELLAPLASELVRAGPDVLIGGFGTLAPKAAITATQTIPIVFTSVGDPVGSSLVKSLREPGGNATGMSVLASDIAAKKLQLLNDLVAGRKLVAVLGNPDTPFTALALNHVKMAATVMGVPLAIFNARTVDEALKAIDRAIGAGAASMLVLEDPVLLGDLRKIVDRLAEARLPAIFGPKECAAAGALIAFGPDQRHLYRKAADYVDKILKGASPASLPVEQPTKFELVINLNTAKRLGLVFPPALLATADEVIE